MPLTFPATLQRRWHEFTALPETVRVRRCLLLSLIFMLAGHAAVMMSGAVFNPNTGEWYHPARRWVSDFAARWPEGMLIKISIALFGIALADFFRGTVQRHCRAGFSALKCWWLLAGTAMIGGLVLVAVFDMSPAQYHYHRPNVLFRLFGADSRFVEQPRSHAEWFMRAQHQLGFRLFVAGFFAAAVSLAWLEWRRTARKFPGPATLLILGAACVFTAWLGMARSTLPGIPQRALLVIMFLWLLREVRGRECLLTDSGKVPRLRGGTTP